MPWHPDYKYRDGVDWRALGVRLMAGDWIKMRVDLHNDPAVIVMADTLKVSDNEVVGLLLKFWSWATNQLTDGTMTGISESWIDRYVGKKGFTKSLEKVKWLTKTDEGFAITKWDTHLSQGAKNRVLGKIRQVRHRKVTEQALQSNDANVTKALPEKRREEKRREEDKEPKTPIPPPSGGLLPGLPVEPVPPKAKHPLAETSPAFRKFYETYPKIRREKKYEAWEVWKRDGLEACADDVMKGLLKYMASEKWRRDGGEYTDNPAKFLRRKMFYDNPAPAKDPNHPY